jgi:hypothetical protein
MNWQPIFDRASGYETFLDTYGTAIHRERWRTAYERASLTPQQKTLIQSFSRRMNVLCLAGAWCGDCVNQCPLIQRIAEASPRIDLRFMDRDVDPAVRSELSVNGGQRVPVVVFLSEDFHECSRYGDRTLTIYRQMAASLAGAACPTGIGGGTSVDNVTAEWIGEFERIQWMLRLSSRLREKHHD